MAIEKIQSVFDWVENECIPREHVMEAQLEGNKWARPPVMLELRAKAKEQGLFNLFLPHHFKESPGLTHLEYACCAEILGRCYWASETVNSHAPESGNIELLAKFCNDKQKEKWLRPLMEGTASSAYSMTEPDVAASDATNVGIRITKDGDEYVINGRKIYGNCMWNKGLAFYIMMGCSDPENPNPWERHSTVIVPADTPGFTQVRNLNVLGKTLTFPVVFLFFIRLSIIGSRLTHLTARLLMGTRGAWRVHSRKCPNPGRKCHSWPRKRVCHCPGPAWTR
jgi:alkylation response protein AidB-like acyl-CoA dehydrogenase